MHPDLLFQIARLRMHDQRQHADRRTLVRRWPRPPSRVRPRVASRMVHLAARLVDEPLPALLRRI